MVCQRNNVVFNGHHYVSFQENNGEEVETDEINRHDARNGRRARGVWSSGALRIAVGWRGSALLAQGGACAASRWGRARRAGRRGRSAQRARLLASAWARGSAPRQRAAGSDAVAPCVRVRQSKGEIEERE
jgi:hypothetical protein